MKVSVIDKTFVEIVMALQAIFNDPNKVAAWIRTKNLNLGGCSPIELMRSGRSRKVLEYIESKDKF